MDGNFLIQSLEWLQNKWDNYLSPIVLVREYEAGVVLNFGKFGRYLKKGINWKFPYPFNEAHKAYIKPETISVEITVTTTDGKTFLLEVIGEFEVEDVRKWLLDANDAFTNVRDLLKGYAADVATDHTSEDLNKKPIRTKIKSKLNDEMETLGARFNKILFGKIALTRSFSHSGIDGLMKI